MKSARFSMRASDEIFCTFLGGLLGVELHVLSYRDSLNSLQIVLSLEQMDT